MAPGRAPSRRELFTEACGRFVVVVTASLDLHEWTMPLWCAPPRPTNDGVTKHPVKADESEEPYRVVPR